MATVDELRAKIKPSGPWFPVPAGTPEADCSRCDADGLYWIRTAKRAKMLVDVNVTGGIDPSENSAAGYAILGLADIARDGRGVAHFATCPWSKEFKR